MNVNLRILAFTNAGVLSLASVVQADEHPMSQVMTTVSSTTLSGYVDTSIIWKAGTGDANLPGRAFDRVGKFDRIDIMTDPQANVDLVQQTLRSRLPAALEVAKPDRRGEKAGAHP